MTASRRPDLAPPTSHATAEPQPQLEPVPVLPLEYAPPVAAGGRAWRRIVLVCLAAGLLTCAGAAFIIYADHVESVVLTGPVLFVTGLLTLLGGLFTRNRAASVVGAAHCGICLLFLLLVNLRRWSPNDAYVPFTVMGTIYTLAIIAPTLYAFSKAR